MMKNPMTSKERVLTAFARQEPDRVPVNYAANAGIDLRLKQHFGLAANDAEGLLCALGVDFRSVWAPYIGPKLHADIPDRQINEWGIHTRWVEHPSGGYWDYCDFPLKDADLETVLNWPLPSPDDYDYSAVPELCKRYQDYCIVIGDAGQGDVMNGTTMIRSMGKMLMDLATDDEACLAYIDRRMAIQLEVLQRTLEAAKGRADVFWMGEDLGSQRGPLISLKLYRKHLRPRHQKFVDLAGSYHLPVVIHSCGSSSWAYEDFIQMGISAVDTLQPEAKDMAPAYLKGRFGDRLAFHGCVSTAGVVATGTVEQTVETVRQTLEVMMPGGGYALSPTHMLQDNSPTENVLAMYEAARKYGQY